MDVFFMSAGMNLPGQSRWELAVDAGDEAFSLVLNTFDGEGNPAASLPALTVTARDIAARQDLDDNARYILPFIPDEGYALDRNLQREACLRGVHHDEMFKTILRPVMVHLFVPFSTDMVSFEDCSLGLIAPSKDFIRCNLPLQEVSRFHYRGKSWHWPVITGPETVKAGGVCEFEIVPHFRDEPTKRPCKLLARTTHGTLSEYAFTARERHVVRLDTAGVPTGTDIELTVNSPFGWPEKHTATTVTVRVEAA